MAAPLVLAEATEFFWIISKMNGRVVDVWYSDPSPGRKVIMWSKNEPATPNQLWIDDPATGTIRNSMRDYCLDIQGERLVVNPYNARSKSQKWERKGDQIVSGVDDKTVLQIEGGNCASGANITSGPYTGAISQKWTFQLSGIPVFDGTSTVE